jgi:hypothetical protein
MHLNDNGAWHDWSILGGPLSPVLAQIDALTDVQSRARALNEEEQDARKATREAVERDKAASEEAFLKGRKDPGTRHADAAAVVEADVARRREAAQSVVRSAHIALLDAVQREAPAWLADIAARREQTERDLAAAVAVVAGHLDHLDHLHRLAATVEDPTDLRAHHRAGTRRVLAVPGAPNGVAAADALRHLADYRRTTRPAPEPTVLDPGKGGREIRAGVDD